MNNNKLAPVVNSEKENFKQDLLHVITLCFCEEMNKTTNGKLSYPGAQTIFANIQAYTKERLGFIPAQIAKACRNSEIVISPTKEAIANFIKTAVGIIGTAGGAVTIAAQIVKIAGCGKSLAEVIMVILAGTSFVTELLLIGAAAIVIGLSIYLMFSGNSAARTEKFLKKLKKNCYAAVDEIWNECGSKLAAA